ncbi:MAG: hypothetical protein ACHQVS_01520, partial [Candidatus Babeliales bacterium]
LEIIKMVKLKLKNKDKLKVYSPTEKLLDEDFIGKGILECLKNNDPEGVIEILSIYLATLNKMRYAQKAKVPRSTLYASLKQKNPTIKTLAKMVYATSMPTAKAR